MARFLPGRVNFESRRAGFTLVEMMLTLALVALLYTMISGILMQVARHVRVGREVAEERFRFLREVENLRYQLRTLHYPSSTVGMVGLRGTLRGRDSVRFLTARGRQHPGVVEVGYKIESYVDPDDVAGGERLGLFYREFPFRRELMRGMEEFQEGRWELLLPNTSILTLEYSSSGQVWQKEWDGTIAPRVIRVRLDRSPPSNDRIAFDVTPGEGAARW
jgi:prepilin-type N-terminal cleavage/methylation domain-containing protein